MRAKTAESLDDSAALIDEITPAARSVNKDIITLCHGGPIAMPDDASYVLRRCKDRLLRGQRRGKTVRLIGGVPGD
jgi:predicted TIM-barrel enzyme